MERGCLIGRNGLENVAGDGLRRRHAHNLQNVAVVEEEHEEADDEAHGLVIVTVPVHDSHCAQEKQSGFGVQERKKNLLCACSSTRMNLRLLAGDL